MTRDRQIHEARLGEVRLAYRLGCREGGDIGGSQMARAKFREIFGRQEEPGEVERITTHAFSCVKPETFPQDGYKPIVNDEDEAWPDTDGLSWWRAQQVVEAL